MLTNERNVKHNTKGKMDDDILVLATIGDAYSFLNGMKLLAEYARNVNLRFSEKGFRIIKANDKGLLIDINVNGEELLEYDFNVVDKNGNPLVEFPIGIELGSLIDRIRSVKRKTAVTLFVKANDERLYIQFGDSASLHIKIIRVDESDYMPITYKSFKPNARISPDVFATAMGNQCNGKSKIIRFFGFERGVFLQGLTSNDEETVVESFGFIPEDAISLLPQKKKKRKIVVCDDEKKEEKSVASIDIDGALATSLVKFSKLCNKAVIKLRLEEKLPLYISTQFGCFGNYTFYVFKDK